MLDAHSVLAHAVGPAGSAGPTLVVAGGLLLGLATVAGAWLARRHAARRELCFGAAAGALLVITGLHLLPDAWSAARQARTPLVPLAAMAVGTFLVAGLAVRRGCGCRDEREAVSGAGTAAALAGHRLLEGAALAMASSTPVAIALTVHALAEGLAAGTLLTSVSRRRQALWLTAMCVSPVAGAVLAGTWTLPPAAQPFLLAVVAGVLAQAAKVSLAAAFQEARPIRPAFARAAFARPAAATLIAAAVTTLAVHAVG
jgi:zinc transporter ZupT